MDREEIVKKFKQKGFSEETINLLLGVIDDFEIAQLTKYVPLEEVVNRICKNLHHDIEFDSIKQGWQGFYRSKEGKIVLSETIRDKQEILSSVIFHEVMHCITDFKDTLSVRI